MKLKRTITALALATGALVGGMSPAGAADAGPRQAAVKANAPDIEDGSPAFKTEYRGKNEATNCPSRAMCLSVWDTTRSPDQWKVFILRTCGIYNVAYWEGGGFWENNQTGNASGTFYRGRNGTGIYTTTAKPYSNGPYGWSPINSVRPCGPS